MFICLPRSKSARSACVCSVVFSLKFIKNPSQFSLATEIAFYACLLLTCAMIRLRVTQETLLVRRSFDLFCVFSRRFRVSPGRISQDHASELTSTRLIFQSQRHLIRVFEPIDFYCVSSALYSALVSATRSASSLHNHRVYEIN